MNLPHFLIVGTQKGGTTWLEEHLLQHPGIFTPKRQVHFFDRNFDKGLDWYRNVFAGHKPGQILGEKTTEYFDTAHGDTVAIRIAQTLPGSRLIVILRNPVDRALSAFQHMVNSGLEPLPNEPNEALFADQKRGCGKGWRYIERGFYSEQLEAIYRHVPAKDVLVLVMEQDIVSNPKACWEKVCEFLEIDACDPEQDLRKKVNSLRLSPLAIRLSKFFYRVPFARGAIRRLDKALGLSPWVPKFSQSTRNKLEEIYRPHNRALAEILDRDLSVWEHSV